MKYALLSVSDTTGLIAFARMLRSKGYTIIATKGTGYKLHAHHIPSIPVEEFTATPTLFGGRIKTLHPRLLGGILFRRKKDTREARKYHIPPIDLVVTNLYPFAEKPTIENIDIGGVTLLRSAAKNHDAVTVICDPQDYEKVAAEILEKGNVSSQTRKKLAAKAFLNTATYDLNITNAFSKHLKIRYGENPHQKAVFRQQMSDNRCQTTDHAWKLISENCKPMSYCNIIDADAAWSLVREFSRPLAACIKHATPCGVASNQDITEAWERAYDTDQLSAFGVVIALNRPCPASIIQKIIDQKIFVEVIVAPLFEKEALELLTKKPNVRVIEIRERRMSNTKCLRSALGGVLMQEPNVHILTKKDLKCVTIKKPTPTQIQDLLFAWHVVKHTLSNAVVFAKNQTTVGIGSGQTSRIDAIHLAAMKAKRCGHNLSGTVMASDAFFPFPDSVEEAAKYGIAAIIQTGGSVKDQEIFAKADELGLAMVTTGVRAFRH